MDASEARGAASSAPEQQPPGATDTAAHAAASSEAPVVSASNSDGIANSSAIPTAAVILQPQTQAATLPLPAQQQQPQQPQQQQQQQPQSQVAHEAQPQQQQQQPQQSPLSATAAPPSLSQSASIVTSAAPSVSNAQPARALMSPRPTGSANAIVRPTSPLAYPAGSAGNAGGAGDVVKQPFRRLPSGLMHDLEGQRAQQKLRRLPVDATHDLSSPLLMARSATVKKVSPRSELLAAIRGGMKLKHSAALAAVSGVATAGAVGAPSAPVSYRDRMDGIAAGAGGEHSPDFPTNAPTSGSRISIKARLSGTFSRSSSSSSLNASAAGGGAEESKARHFHYDFVKFKPNFSVQIINHQFAFDAVAASLPAVLTAQPDAISTTISTATTTTTTTTSTDPSAATSAPSSVAAKPFTEAHVRKVLDAVTFDVRVTSGRRSWTLQRSWADFSAIDEQLHRCIFNRKYSQLACIESDIAPAVVSRQAAVQVAAGTPLSLIPVQLVVEPTIALLATYLKRLATIAAGCLTCSVVLSWLDITPGGKPAKRGLGTLIPTSLVRHLQSLNLLRGSNVLDLTKLQLYRKNLRERRRLQLERERSRSTPARSVSSESDDGAGTGAGAGAGGAGVPKVTFSDSLTPEPQAPSNANANEMLVARFPKLRIVAVGMVIAPYESQEEDELSLQAGEVISIVDMPSTQESPWWRGFKGASEMVGFFPRDCVQVITPASASDPRPPSPMSNSSSASPPSLSPSIQHLSVSEKAQNRRSGTWSGANILDSSLMEQASSPTASSPSGGSLGGGVSYPPFPTASGSPRPSGKLKIVTFLRSFFHDRHSEQNVAYPPPSLVHLRRSGIFKDAVFGADLSELLQRYLENPDVHRLANEVLQESFQPAALEGAANKSPSVAIASSPTTAAGTSSPRLQLAPAAYSWQGVAQLQYLPTVPIVIQKCVHAIERLGKVKGIYRVSGTASRVQKLRFAFDANEDKVNLDDIPQSDIHCVSSLLKLYLRELPTPLIPTAQHESFLRCVGIPAQLQRVTALQHLMLRLPPAHLATLRYLLRHLSLMNGFHEKTSMASSNLAIVWAPNFLRARDAASPMLAKLLDEVMPTVHAINSAAAAVAAAAAAAAASPTAPSADSPVSIPSSGSLMSLSALGTSSSSLSDSSLSLNTLGGSAALAQSLSRCECMLIQLMIEDFDLLFPEWRREEESEIADRRRQRSRLREMGSLVYLRKSFSIGVMSAIAPAPESQSETVRVPTPALRRCLVRASQLYEQMGGDSNAEAAAEAAFAVILEESGEDEEVSSSPTQNLDSSLNVSGLDDAADSDDSENEDGFLSANRLSSAYSDVEDETAQLQSFEDARTDFEGSENAHPTGDSADANALDSNADALEMIGESAEDEDPVDSSPAAAAAAAAPKFLSPTVNRSPLNLSPVLSPSVSPVPSHGLTSHSPVSGSLANLAEENEDCEEPEVTPVPTATATATAAAKAEVVVASKNTAEPQKSAAAPQMAPQTPPSSAQPPASPSQASTAATTPGSVVSANPISIGKLKRSFETPGLGVAIETSPAASPAPARTTPKKLQMNWPPPQASEADPNQPTSPIIAVLPDSVKKIVNGADRIASYVLGSYYPWGAKGANPEGAQAEPSADASPSQPQEAEAAAAAAGAKEPHAESHA